MNAPLAILPHVEPFFFDADPGTRFCLYHAPNPHLAPRGTILYVHPFAEEMNKTRRMAAQQARAFAAIGFAVLQVDLFGCGDSCGDFHAGRWDIWKRDLGAAADWLRARDSGPLYLWGARLGGLLALDFAANRQVAGIILWHPFTNGRTCVNQFLRLRLAAGMDAGGPGAPRTTAALRAELAVHGRLEVAGYELDCAMARGIDACEAANLKPLPCSVHWFASATPGGRRMADSAARLAERWAPLGVTLRFHTVDGVPFWATADVAECPALLAATTSVMAADAP